MTARIALISLAFSLLFLPSLGQTQNVSMEKIAYGGWENCLRLTNGKIEAVVTTDVGPRVIRLGFVGEQNVFKEYADQMGKTGGQSWNIYGGHRLWHAPEASPRTYAVDNSPVKYEWNGKTLKLMQQIEETTRIVKEIEITLDANANHIRLNHRLINANQWDIELSPWCLSVMAPGGRAIIPQEDYRPHPEYLLPARPIVLWHYTNMSDPRWTWGEKYIQLRQDPNAKVKQKAGVMNRKGWMAYLLNGDLFVKKYPFVDGAKYPDFGCNTETYTDADMLEMESIGPLTKLSMEGGKVEHIEDWYLFKADFGEKESEIDAKLLPLIR